MATQADSSTSNTESIDGHLETLAGGFEFGARRIDEHTVTVSYTRYYSDEIRVEDGDVIEIGGDGGTFGPDDNIECTCGETFGSRDDAKAHLEDIRQKFCHTPPITPLVDLSDAGVTTGEDISIFGGCVSAQPVRHNYIAVVKEGGDYLAATSRDKYHPPEDYKFEGWEPLSSDGRLSYTIDGESGPLFKRKSLKEAMQFLTRNRATYDPERYTIYFRGDSPLYIEGGGKGVILATVKTV